MSVLAALASAPGCGGGGAAVVFTTPGFCPFLCPEHVDQGMLGVVWVTP